MSNQKEKPQYWVFTFGCGQEHGGHYVKIFGTFNTARNEMIERYGDEWCWQYTWDKWQEMVENATHPMETELIDSDWVE